MEFQSHDLKQPHFTTHRVGAHWFLKAFPCKYVIPSSLRLLWSLNNGVSLGSVKFYLQ